MPPRADRDPSHRPFPVSRADVARWSGRARATITEACAGPLAAACLPGGRVDAAHPAVARWALARGLDLASLLAPAAAQQAPAPAPAEVLAADVLGRPRPRIAPPTPPIDCPPNIE